MRIFVTILALAVATAALADDESQTAAQRPVSGAVAIEIDPDLIIMDVDEAKKLTEDVPAELAEPPAATRPAAAPTPPQTRVIELNPAPVAIVNRTNHFRIVSRRPAERQVEASDTTAEAAEK